MFHLQLEGGQVAVDKNDRDQLSADTHDERGRQTDRERDSLSNSVHRLFVKRLQDAAGHTTDVASYDGRPF